MRERLTWLRWVFLGVAVVVLVVFLVAQRQAAVDVSYGTSPSSKDKIKEGSADELTDEEIPSNAQIEKLLDKQEVVRLPGAIAHWDTKRVQDAMGADDMRILVAPPGLSKKDTERLSEIDGVDIRIIGTDVSGESVGASSDDLAGWRGEYATGDVTSLLSAIIAYEQGKKAPPDVDLFEWREPTASELSAVTTDLRDKGLHVADGATLEGVPESASTAFPDKDPLVVALPRQKFGEPAPEFGPALADRFPDTPIVVMYGNWITYHGPHAAEFAEVAAATFYGQFGSRVSRWDYPQRNLLGVYLNRVTDIRYAGLFDRPLPYQPFDPLRVTLPALPWLFAACVLVFLALSVRSLLSQSAQPRQAPARLARLNALALEMSGLSREPALVRGIGKLQAAASALDENLPARHVQRLIDQAQRELDVTARKLGRDDYRPQNYLAGGIT